MSNYAPGKVVDIRLEMAFVFWAQLGFSTDGYRQVGAVRRV